ncbi:MAG: alpha/beta hydrolase, partial [Bacillota bacterium]
MSDSRVRETEGRLTGKGGVDLFYRRARPPEGGPGPRAILALVHGVGEHSGRYTSFARRFAERGLAVYAADLRGFGQSSGRRAYVGSFDDYLDDYDALVELARRENPGLPVVAYGHSLGGLIVLHHGVTGRSGPVAYISSAPGLVLRLKVPPAKLALAKVAGRLMPTFSQYNEIDPGALSRNPEVGRAYAADPLLCRVVTAGFFRLFTSTQATTMARADRFTRPLLILQGTADKLVDPEGSRRFYDRAASTDKTFRSYEGFYHELHNEDERETVFGDVDR